MPREQTICPKSARGHVRTLIQQEELPLLRDHLLRLDAASRHDRFNGFLDDGFIERYAARCAEDDTVIIAYIKNDAVRGAAELDPPDQSPDSLPEIAFSVEASVRRQGVGTICSGGSSRKHEARATRACALRPERRITRCRRSHASSERT